MLVRLLSFAIFYTDTNTMADRKWMSDVCLLFFDLTRSHVRNMGTMELGRKEIARQSTHWCWTCQNNVQRVHFAQLSKWVCLQHSFILPVTQVVVSLPSLISSRIFVCFAIEFGPAHVQIMAFCFRLWRLMHGMLGVDRLLLVMIAKNKFDNVSQQANCRFFLRIRIKLSAIHFSSLHWIEDRKNRLLLESKSNFS